MCPLVTIVFTDVVQSSATRREPAFGRDDRERDQVYIQSVQTPHFKVVREWLAIHGGREVKTMGDSFLVIFEDPLSAVRFAVDIQRALVAAPIATPRGALRIRIGIHSGYPQIFDQDYHGTDVDIAARVESVASAGQILVSATTYNLVKGMSDVAFCCQGTRDLRGIGPAEVWEVNWEDRQKTIIPIRPSMVRSTAVVGIAGLGLLLTFDLWRPTDHAQGPRTVDQGGDFHNQSGDSPIPVTLHLKNTRTNEPVPDTLVTFDRYGVITSFYSDASGMVRCQLAPDEYLVKTAYENEISSRMIRISYPKVDLDFPVPSRP
jgi:class 3 adenylate cyclase